MWRRAVLHLKACDPSSIESKTVVGLQLNHPSDAATRSPLFDAIVVIGLDCEAERGLGIDRRRGIAPVGSAFPFILAAVFAPFMQHVLKTLAIFFIASLTIHTQFTYMP